MKNKIKSFFKTKYRIVKDEYLGYEAQQKVWWFPIWTQCGLVNTHSSVERARLYIDKKSKHGCVNIVEYYEPFNQDVKLRDSK